MKISKEELKQLANRLLFDMEDSEYETLQEEFATLLSQMELLGGIEGADEMEPMAFPFLMESIGLREDEPVEVLTQEEVLQNTSDKCDNQIRVKKVI